MDLFSGKAAYDPLWNVYKFVKRCEGLSVCNVNKDITKLSYFLTAYVEMLKMG
jgi:hypothetical protein